MFLDDPGLPLIGFGFRDGMCPYVYGLGLGDCGELRARGRLKWRLESRVMADKRGQAGGHESRPDGRGVDMSFPADASDARSGLNSRLFMNSSLNSSLGVLFEL